jgi:hypothetical protein
MDCSEKNHYIPRYDYEMGILAHLQLSWIIDSAYRFNDKFAVSFSCTSLVGVTVFGDDSLVPVLSKVTSDSIPPFHSFCLS